MSENAILFQIKNITVQFRSNAFSYWLLTVPIEGYMDAFMSGTQFMIKMAFINKQVNGKTLP